jgi:uncharacterized protein
MANVTSQREEAPGGAATIERVTFPSARGVRLAGLLHAVGPALAGTPTVVLCHGMESTKEGTKHQALATRLAALGYACLRFDFSYVGESGGAFEDLTIGGEVDDLAGACAFVRARGGRELALIGSSLGGTVALLHAGADGDVRALVTIAAVSRPRGIIERMDPGALAVWRKTGYREEATGRLKRSFLDDLSRHDVLAAARRTSAATLVTHGDQDRVVPVEDAYALHAVLPAPKKLVITPACDHRYSDPAHLAALLDDTVGWITTYVPIVSDATPRRRTS